MILTKTLLKWSLNIKLFSQTKEPVSIICETKYIFWFRLRNFKNLFRYVLSSFILYLHVSLKTTLTNIYQNVKIITLLINIITIISFNKALISILIWIFLFDKNKLNLFS